MTATGSVYVRVEGEEKDIFVNQRNTANALNGDRVEVVVMHRGRDGQMEGEITHHRTQPQTPMSASPKSGRTRYSYGADSRRMPMDIYLSKRPVPRREGRRKGRRAHRRLAEGEQSPVGELIERLGMAGNNDTEMHAILAGIRAALPLRAQSRAGGRGYRRPDYGQRRSPSAAISAM